MNRQQQRARERARARLTEGQIDAEVRKDAELQAQKNYALESACAQRGSLALQALQVNIGEGEDAQEIKRLSKAFLVKMFNKANQMVEHIDYSYLDEPDGDGDGEDEKLDDPFEGAAAS